MKRLAYVFSVVLAVGMAGALFVKPVAAQGGCSGLSCQSQGDCGSNCFCNTPSTTCFSNNN
jgi:hypothetical protein